MSQREYNTFDASASREGFGKGGGESSEGEGGRSAHSGKEEKIKTAVYFILEGE